MPRISVFTSIVAAALVTVLSAADASAGVKVGDRATEFVNARDARGKRVRLKSYRNKVVVVTFGASWCEPCKKELPAWEALARAYKKKGVVFLALNHDKNLATGKAFVKKANLRVMRAAYEPTGATVESYDPPTMPTTYIIDGRGIVRHMHTGYRAGDSQKLSRELDRLLK